MAQLSARLLRRSAAIAVAGIGIALYAAPAFAEHVDISGTHSKDEIKADCDAVGGIMVEGDGGKGYGCFNYHKNTMVACDDDGKCDGFVPGRVTPTHGHKPIVPAGSWFATVTSAGSSSGGAGSAGVLHGRAGFASGLVGAGGSSVSTGGSVTGGSGGASHASVGHVSVGVLRR